MISPGELKGIAQARLREANVLMNSRTRARSYDGAIYLGGYAVEMVLKGVICKNMGGILSETHIPNTLEEFKMVGELRTHNLDDLLRLAGLEAEVKGTTPKRLAAWSTVQKWHPERRYSPIKGRAMAKEAREFLAATRTLLHFISTKI